MENCIYGRLVRWCRESTTMDWWDDN